MNRAGRLGGCHSLADGPGAVFGFSNGEKRLQIQHIVSSPYQLVHPGFRQTGIFQKSLPVRFVFQLGNFRFQFPGYHQHFGIFGQSGFHLFHISISRNRRSIIHIANINNRLGRQQQQIVNVSFIAFFHRCRTGITKIFEVFFVNGKHFDSFFGFFVSGFGQLFQPLQFTGHQVQVAHLQFKIHDFQITHRIYRTFDVCQVLIIKASQHVNQRIGLLHIGQELVAHAFAVAGTFGQAGQIHNLHRGRYHFVGRQKPVEFVQPRVGHIHHANVRFDSTESIAGAFGFGVRHTIKNGGLPRIGQTDNSAI